MGRNHVQARIGADTSEYRTKMQGMQAASRTAMNAITGIFAGLSFHRLIGEVTSLINKLDDMAKSARNMGQTFEERAVLDYVARRMGISLQDIDTAVSRMTRALYEGGTQAERYEEMLGNVGIRLSDLRDMSPTDMFVALSKAVGAVENQTSRLAIAQEIFGRRGRRVLEVGSNYETLAAEAAKVVGVTEEAAVQAEAFKDATVDLQEALKSLLVDSGIVGRISDIAGYWSDAAQKLRGFNKEYAWLEAASFMFNPLKQAEFIAEQTGRLLQGAETGRFGEGFVRPGTPGAGAHAHASLGLSKEEEDAQRAITAEKIKQERLDAEAVRIEEERAGKVQGSLEALEHATRLQELRNDGLEYEAFIMEQKRRIGEELTGEERDQLDLLYQRIEALKEEEAITGRTMGMSLRSAGMERLARIGGGLFSTGAANLGNQEGLRLDRARNNKLDGIQRAVENQSFGMV